MLDENVSHAVMETSSHAIDLGRIDTIRIRIGVFTNLSQDHLDYHGDMESYWECKKRFFTENLDNSDTEDPAFAVLNCMNDRGRELQSILAAQQNNARLITIGDTAADTVQVLDSDIRLSGIAAAVKTPLGRLEFRSPLVGRFNLENLLCAVGVGYTLNLPIADIQAGIEGFSSVPGRLEPVLNESGRFVFVDYAHTPDALENVLATLRDVTHGRLICIFGCGGDRDRTKRPLMGNIAGKLSDLCIITSDNPRTEDRMAIIDEIVAGVGSGKQKLSDEARLPLKGYLIVPDRRIAIQKGIEAAASGDTILIAGKGHETYQIIGRQKIPFDDRIEAANILKRIGA